MRWENINKFNSYALLVNLSVHSIYLLVLSSHKITNSKPSHSSSLAGDFNLWPSIGSIGWFGLPGFKWSQGNHTGIESISGIKILGDGLSTKPLTRSHPKSQVSPVSHCSMAMVRANEPEPEDQVVAVAGLSLCGLAEAWETDLGIRHRARQLGSLLNWGEPTKVGVASMILISTKIYFCGVCDWVYHCHTLRCFMYSKTWLANL